MANKDERLILAIDDELKAKLQQAADDNGISMSEVVRRLLKTIPFVEFRNGEAVIVHPRRVA